VSATTFRLTGPLPRGVTVLEASAGTGKTYAIAGLVVRYVAEGYRLPRLLVVTFTRAATAELRERVRARLVGAADHLERVLDGAPTPADDEVYELLAEGTRAEVARRHERLAAALAEFDAATIATIHGFCQQVLHGVGLAGDVERDATFLEDRGQLVETVVDDLFVRTFHAREADAPLLRRSELLAIARAVVGNPDARVVPHASDEPLVTLRLQLAAAARAEVDRRKRTARLLSYDDLLTRLASTLDDPRHGPAARARLRGQYDVALIDEFQDTDPVQWRIFANVFGSGDAALVLIGDPKQAIYTFRGADVYAYLSAARGAVRQTLTTNWRSDAALLDAYNVLFADAALGHPDIRYLPVAAAPGRTESCLVGAPGAAPLRLRVLSREGHATTRHASRSIPADSARAHIARDLAAEIVALLDADAALLDRDRDGRECARGRVRPGDLAVLVRANAEAALVQRTLRDAGVPAVINGVGSVFATDAATEWLRLLEALERPSSPSRARVAALTAFVGWTGTQVARADEDDWEAIAERLRRWAAILREGSVASLLRTITLSERLPERLLQRPDGERRLTDLEHVAELLHAAAAAEQLGVTALSGWLRERIAEAEDDLTSEERARRLESDADAVQVLTIHRSKGLEFPIVYCPFLWSSGRVTTDVPLFHDPEAGEERVVDVGGKQAPEFEAHAAQAKAEQRGEELRLVYVALTRARHQAVVWWAPAGYSDQSPLAKLLFCRRRDGTVQSKGTPQLPNDEVTLTRLGELAARAPGRIAVEAVAPTVAAVRWAGEARAAHDLAAAAFGRELDHRWRRTSYSALTAVSAAAGPSSAVLVGSEPDTPVVDDEASLPGAAEDVPAEEEPSLLGDVPGGAEFGTFVHAVLEHTDFAGDDLDAALHTAVREQLPRARLEGIDGDVVVRALHAAIETPLGPLAGDLRLRDVARRDRLDELTFELPLVGGLAPTADLRVDAVADLLRAHLPAADRLAGYAERLGELRGDLRGYLTGSLDCVLRLPGSRFTVVDYKTNRLDSYRPAALAVAMQHGHYGLQALLYVVALHRYLRWRVSGYDPDEHLAGVLYLFVRGMVGADTPRDGGAPSGVFAWRPPSALVVALSDLLDRGQVAA
jgi:exodeoxyribonuclease V beta subunit